MGQARKRGTFEARRDAAIKRNKALLVEEMGGGRDKETTERLRTGLTAFLCHLSPEDWAVRKGLIVERLTAATKIGAERVELSSTPPIRDREDEIGWYLFLCEQALDDPLCVDVNQAARALPFLAGIGERWVYAPKVNGLGRKIEYALRAGKKDADGYIFEILVALSYAAAGWRVDFIEEKSSAKTPDMVAQKADRTIYIECKRQSRRAAYAEQERNDFLTLWNPCVDVLMENKQWIWLKGTFHEEISKIDPMFLRDILKANVPLKEGTQSIHDGPIATLKARLIDRVAVWKHLAEFRVKANSPTIVKLLGGDWAPLNSSTTAVHLVKTSNVVGCQVPMLGTYIDEIGWACGITREFDSEISIEKKARDVKNLLADAVRQVPDSEASVIHIAVETLEGAEVERRRTEKVMRSIPSFITGKPVLGVRLHLLQANQTIDKLFEFDETVEQFQIDGAILDDIPTRVVIPSTANMTDGRHWEIYG
jgi:hypothetical protein